MLSAFHALMKSRNAYQQLLDVMTALMLVFAILASQRDKEAKAATEEVISAETVASAALVEAEKITLQKHLAEQSLQAEQERRLQAELATARSGRQIKRLEERLEKLDQGMSEPVRLHFVVDCSLSLGDELPELKSAIKTITRVMSDLGREVSVSVVGYREQLVARLPTTRIVPAGEDRGASTRRLDQALDKLQAVNGFANVPAGFEFALQQRGGRGKEILLWLADQDAREAADQLKLGSQPALENRLANSVKQWASQPGTDRRVVAYYASHKEPVAPPLFKRLAAATPDGVFEDDIMNLLAVLLKATLPTAE